MTTQLQTYATFSPTGFDQRGLGLTDRQDWLVGPCKQNRDSDTLDQSNWAAQERELTRVDPEQADHEIHRFGHWAVGWFEIVIVRPGSPAAQTISELADRLAAYPILDTEDWAERQVDLADATWSNTSLSERIQLCREAGLSIFAARHDQAPSELFDELTD